LDDNNEARADGGRPIQMEGLATKKDLDLAIVVLVRGTKSSRQLRELIIIDDGMRQKSEVGWGHGDIKVPPLKALRTIRRTLLYRCMQVHILGMHIFIISDNLYSVSMPCRVVDCERL